MYRGCQDLVEYEKISVIEIAKRTGVNWKSTKL